MRRYSTKIKPTSLGFHKNCGGVVHNEATVDQTKKYGIRIRIYTKCSACGYSSVHPSDILETRPDYAPQKFVGRKAKRRPKYDIKSWKDVKA